MPNKLNKQEFKNLYDNCYLTGWTMSKFYDDLYEEQFGEQNCNAR